jgi:hypothetical protein
LISIVVSSWGLADLLAAGVWVLVIERTAVARACLVSNLDFTNGGVSATMRP